MAPAQQRMEAEGQQLDDSREEVERKIKNARKNGYTKIVLTGGEVTLRPDFVDLVEFAISQGLNVTIQTNARKLSEPALLDLLSNFSREKIDFVVAYHSDIPTVHDSITRREGSHAQTVEAIRSLRALRFEVNGKIVLSLANYSGLTAILTSLNTLGVRDVIVAFPHAEEFSADRFSEVVPRYALVTNPLHEAIEESRTKGMQILCETIPFCVMHDMDWPSNLDLHHIINELDPLITVISMPGQPELIDWRQSRKEIKSKAPQCASCLLDKLCEGPWMEYATHFGFSEFVPVDDFPLVERFVTRL